MKTGVLLIGFFFLAGILKTWTNSTAHPEMSALKSDPNPSGRSFAVVELFTSEGCSSCPPADKLLAEIVEEAAKKQQRIFALAFHVDYWDYIGWKDPFADWAYSDRQREYAAIFRRSQIYTPQMIVNGQSEFVGSNRSKAESAIAWALSQSQMMEIKLQKLGGAQVSELRLSFEVSPARKGSVLHLALVERDLVNNIKRGENSGRTLSHDNVVRVFKTIALNGASGETVLMIPSFVNLKKSSIIAYVQDTATLKIVGASSIDSL